MRRRPAVAILIIDNQVLSFFSFFFKLKIILAFLTDVCQRTWVQGVDSRPDATVASRRRSDRTVSTKTFIRKDMKTRKKMGPIIQKPEGKGGKKIAWRLGENSAILRLSETAWSKNGGGGGAGGRPPES